MNAITKAAQAVALNVPDVFCRDPVNGPIAEASRDQLIPADTCKIMLSQLDAASRSSPDRAKATLTHILACYGTERKDPRELAALMTMMQADLESVPEGLHREVLDDLTKTERFFPTRKALTDAIGRVMAKYHTARHIAERHLSRHRMLDKDRTPIIPEKTDGKAALATMPKTSELAATVAASLCRLDGRDPLTDDDLEQRKAALQEMAAEQGEPTPAKTVTMDADQRRAALAAALQRRGGIECGM